MWKLLLNQLLGWIKDECAGPSETPQDPIPPELADQARREEIEILSEQRLRLWRATGAYQEFDFQELAESGLCLVRAVEEQIDLLGQGPCLDA